MKNTSETVKEVRPRKTTSKFVSETKKLPEMLKSFFAGMIILDACLARLIL